MARELDPPDARGKLKIYLQDTAATKDPIAGLSCAGRYLASAWDSGVLAPLALDAKDLDDAPWDPDERMVALRDRLRQLGYAPPDVPDVERGLWDDGIKATLLAFQRESSLAEQDGELTVESWDALQELFNFETHMDVPSWFSNGVPDPSLLRAASVRLRVLGLCDKTPSVTDYAPDANALEAFASVAFDLGLTQARLATKLDEDFASALFDYDSMIEKLAASADRLNALPQPRRDAARNFLVCVGKAEIWLQGYDSVPDGNSTLRILRRMPHKGTRFFNNNAADQFNRFIRDLSPQTRAPALKAAAIPDAIPAMLSGALRLRADGASMSRDNISELVVNNLEQQLKEDDGLWARICAAAKKMSGLLFDGARRVISWLGRLIKGTVKLVADSAYNLWRAVYQFMGSAVFNLRKALRAFTDGVGFFLSPVQSSPSGSVRWFHRADMDAFLLASQDADETETHDFGIALRHKSGCLRIACKIINIALTALRACAYGFAATLGGFIPAVFALASVYSQIRLLIPELDAP